MTTHMLLLSLNSSPNLNLLTEYFVNNYFILLQECQSLIENNRRLMGDPTLSSERLNGTNSSVEETLLQTQVDSLQWQLKQVTKQ